MLVNSTLNLELASKRPKTSVRPENVREPGPLRIRGFLLGTVNVLHQTTADTCATGNTIYIQNYILCISNDNIKCLHKMFPINLNFRLFSALTNVEADSLFHVNWKKKHEYL